MKAYVGVTDGEWYRFLASRPMLDEVNFWRPSGGRTFRVLTPGEPFFFKTHSPHNRVVGGGFFSGHAELRLSEAWEFFGQANGMESLEDLRRRVGRYRNEPIRPGDDPTIGCVFVRDVMFFPPDATADPPPDFAPNIVQGKSYELSEVRTRSYFEELLSQLLAREVEEPWRMSGPTLGDPRLTKQRLGQRSFKAVVLNAYGRRCAVTGAKIRPVLEAAHIRPVAEGGEHRLDNGLLLRSDIHTLYDSGYIGVDSKHRLLVSPRLRAEFQNGDDLYAKRGSQITLPPGRADRPNPEFLEWHLDEVFMPS